MNRKIDISACYIVKDEADILARSLEAIRPFVDELVVYDTGSTDSTVLVARECGARVIEGFWDDDFGAARNRALEHCRGALVVSVDADEEAFGDARRFRQTLLRQPLVDVFSVEVHSVVWDGAAPSMGASITRVLRRATCTWAGALHEQIVGRDGRALRRGETGMGLLHSGYSVVRFREKNKATRNLDLAQRELERALADGRPGVDHLRMNVGRAAQGADQFEAALDAFESIDMVNAHRVLAASAAHGAIDAGYALKRVDVLQRWIRRLEVLGEDRNVVARARALEATVAQRWDDVVRHLDGLQDARDIRGFRFIAASTAPLRMTALYNGGHVDEAAGVILDHVRSGVADVEAAIIIRVVKDAGHELGELVDALPDSLVVPFLGQLQAAPYSEGAPFFDAMWQRARAREAVVLTVSSQARSIDLGSILIWSLRAREIGMVDHCPLRLVFHDEHSPVGRRVVCGAALVEVGEDVQGELEQLLAHVPDEEAATVVAAIAQVSPAIAATLQLV